MSENGAFSSGDHNDDSRTFRASPSDGASYGVAGGMSTTGVIQIGREQRKGSPPGVPSLSTHRITRRPRAGRGNGRPGAWVTFSCRKANFLRPRLTPSWERMIMGFFLRISGPLPHLGASGGRATPGLRGPRPRNLPGFPVEEDGDPRAKFPPPKGVGGGRRENKEGKPRRPPHPATRGMRPPTWANKRKIRKPGEPIAYGLPRSSLASACPLGRNGTSNQTADAGADQSSSASPRKAAALGGVPVPSLVPLGVPRTTPRALPGKPE